jgi:hypothetical protein
LPALAQWEVRPAPPSWGGTVPVQPRQQPAPPPTSTATAPAPQQSGPTSVVMAQSVQGSSSFDAAVRCAAALQIATLAAPTWAREPGPSAATNRWLATTFQLAEGAGVAGDRVSGIVQDEMQRQTSDAATDPTALSRRAFDCAANAPA